MKQIKNRRGFTLIEMLVVVAIISILAGVVLTGVTGFQANARDTKRIADIKQIQGYLELYFNKWGHYPGDATGAFAAANNPTTWAQFVAALGGLGVTVPSDPVPSKTYFYGVKTSDNLQYVVGAKLERSNNALNGPQVIHDTTGFTGTTGMDCTLADLGYCVGS